eukprot:8235536-Lingulodinium_polyedra.AAC.1
MAWPPAPGWPHCTVRGGIQYVVGGVVGLCLQYVVGLQYVAGVQYVDGFCFRCSGREENSV